MTTEMTAEVAFTAADGIRTVMTLEEWLALEGDDLGDEVSIDLHVRGGDRVRLTRAMLRRAAAPVQP